MRDNFTYCTPDESCKKRYFCQRSTDNYTIQEINNVDFKIEMLSCKACVKHNYINFIDVNEESQKS